MTDRKEFEAAAVNAEDLIESIQHGADCLELTGFPDRAEALRSILATPRAAAVTGEQNLPPEPPATFDALLSIPCNVTLHDKLDALARSPSNLAVFENALKELWGDDSAAKSVERDREGEYESAMVRNMMRGWNLCAALSAAKQPSEKAWEGRAPAFGARISGGNGFPVLITFNPEQLTSYSNGILQHAPSTPPQPAAYPSMELSEEWLDNCDHTEEAYVLSPQDLQEVVRKAVDWARLHTAAAGVEWLVGFDAAIARVEDYDRARPMDAPGKLIATEILIVLREMRATQYQRDNEGKSDE